MYVKRFKETDLVDVKKKTDLVIYVNKVHLLFLDTYLKTSWVKCSWIGVAKRCVTYLEVIRNIMRVIPKHGKRSQDNCIVNKQLLRISGNYTPTVARSGPMGQVNMHRRPNNRGRLGCYKWYQNRRRRVWNHVWAHINISDNLGVQQKEIVFLWEGKM